MTLIQAILIGCVAALTQLEGDWLGECKLREPVITGFLVGLIMGDVQKGLMIGGALQLMWMGATNIGPTAGLDIGSGGTIGAAVALITGSDLEIAIAFAIPVAVIVQMLNILKMTAFSGLMHKADSYIDEGKEGKVIGIHFLCGIFTFVIYFTFTFLVLFAGDSVINAIVNSIPEWVHSGLGAVAIVLPAMGFALLLNLLWETKLIPYFVIGFIFAAYLGVSMVGICALSVAIAAVIYMLKADQLKGNAQAEAAVDDEWED